MLELEQKLDAKNSKEYKIEAICNREVYIKEFVGQLLGFYYLIY